MDQNIVNGTGVGNSHTPLYNNIKAYYNLPAGKAKAELKKRILTFAQNNKSQMDMETQKLVALGNSKCVAAHQLKF